MKLKDIATDLDSLNKFSQFIDKLDLDSSRINKKDLFYGDCKKDFCIYCDETINDNEIKSIIKKYANRYWKNFEEQIDFHRYDNDNFIQIKQKSNENNVWEFILEAKDDSIYFKFNTNLVSKL